MKRYAVLVAVLIGCATFAVAAPSRQEKAATPPDGAPTLLVTGANRGLGLEFAKQFKAAGWQVIGTARRPAKADELRSTGAIVMQLDVTDAASVEKLAKDLDGRPIDLLINNAGIGDRTRSITDVDFDEVERVLAVNTIGPMRVTKALLPNLRAGEGKLIVGISSRLGSIEGNGGGAYFGYRESKAALNMFTRSIAAELKPEGFICIAMSPGWVRTDMGGSQATLSPEESIRGMRSVIDGLKPESTGTFFSYDGTTVPW